MPIRLPVDAPPMLAVGGELKNTFCVARGREAWLSQHIGDMGSVDTLAAFERATGQFAEMYQVDAGMVVADGHPGYQTRRWAEAHASHPVVLVQHHHAHIASCMAENNLEDKVIGFALDGTGYGTDGNIWGGEVLNADYAVFERAAHFEYVPLPGGAAAIHDPWRMAVSYLAHHFGDEFLKMKLPFLAEISRSRFDLLLRVLDRRVNSPLTSSCGRLFDAVAAIAGIRNQVSYEAQAAIELEMAIGEDKPDSYRFQLLQESGTGIISTRPMFESLVEDVLRGTPVSGISRKFHNGLVNIFVEIARTLRDHTSLNRVCLSGGTFNNLYLTKNLLAALAAEEFEVFTQNEVPAGDGGLSLGQALVAAHRGRP